MPVALENSNSNFGLGENSVQQLPSPDIPKNSMVGPKFFEDVQVPKKSSEQLKNPPPTKLAIESFGKNLFHPKKVHTNFEIKGNGLNRFF